MKIFIILFSICVVFLIIYLIIDIFNKRYLLKLKEKEIDLELLKEKNKNSKNNFKD
jgi:amino acid permease